MGIKFFYFTLFKKNGFIFLIICTIIYNNFFLDLLVLLIKSFIVFYLTLYVIYIIFLIQKFIYISMKILFNICFKYYPTLILFVINYFLNALFNIVGIDSFNSNLICKKFGFQPSCTLKTLESYDLGQLKVYLTNNYSLDNLLVERVNKNVKKK